MKRVGNIYDKICDLDNIINAHHHARKDKSYYKEVKMVNSDIEYYCKQIQDILINETYTPSNYITKTIHERDKDRVLNKLPYYPDRIIQWAILLQIESVFMSVFCSHTCASIVGRGGSKAIELMKQYLKDTEGTQFALKLDVRKFYPTINREVLKQLLRKKFKDKQLLRLLDLIIDSAPNNEFDQEEGVPIGSYLSQFLANYYLAYLDHYIKEDLGVKYAVRYMDDIIILGKTKEELHYIREKIQEYLINVLQVELKKNYQVFPVDKRPIEFIGYVFTHTSLKLKKKTSKRMKRRLVRIKKKIDSGQALSRKDWGAINSYYGRAKMCDDKGFGIINKYITPLSEAIVEYYQISTDYDKNDPKKRAKFRSFLKKFKSKNIITEEQERSYLYD